MEFRDVEEMCLWIWELTVVISLFEFRNLTLYEPDQPPMGSDCFMLKK